MKKYLSMIEVLGEGGELQPLLWSPNHLTDGRTILIVDEAEARIWVWLGKGTTMVQRTTALRQARFIMRNGIHIEETSLGTKCTEFIEIGGDLNISKAAPLRDVLEANPKAEEYLIVVKHEEALPTPDEAFQSKVDAIEQTILPEPTRQPPQPRRRILTYEEQLAAKVLYAVSDCYGQATITPLGPNQFEVSVPRLQLRFFCQGDAILFSLIRAAAQDDIDGFSRCFGQSPQLTENGQQYIDPALAAGAPLEERRVPTKEPTSIADSVRQQLSKLKTIRESSENDETAKTEDAEKNAKPEESAKGKDADDNGGGTEDFTLFA